LAKILLTFSSHIQRLAPDLSRGGELWTDAVCARDEFGEQATRRCLDARTRDVEFDCV
jgi:hypothetical protein